MDVPETRYTRSGDLHIAYQAIGSGPLDVVLIPLFVSNIEAMWDIPDIARFMRRIASYARLIVFDRRGSGLSDGTPGMGLLEEQVDDVRAVMDAVGARQPALLSVTEGCALAALFAASHPELTRALVMMTPIPRLVSGPGYEWAQSPEDRDALVKGMVATWGQDSPLNIVSRLARGDLEGRKALARHQRLSMSPGAGAVASEVAGQIDVRHVLPSIQCPTLVIRRIGDTFIDARHSRYVADHIPDARYAELPGDGAVYLGEIDEPADEIEHFLTGARHPVVSDRVLATVLFTDIVSSTERAAQLGDGAWRALLQRHDALVREQVERHRGRFVKSLGDGALATFDGPSRAIDSAVAIRDGVRELDLEIRAGLHTGECELLADDDIGGLAVHIGARISSLAGPSEVLVSSTIRDLSIGSGQTLIDRGEHDLKGVPGPWRIFAVAP